MHVYRCSGCKRLLFRARTPGGGTLDIVCPDRRCRRSQRVVLIDETRAEQDADGEELTARRTPCYSSRQ